MENALFDVSPEANDARALEALRTDPLRGMATDWATALAPVEPALKALGAFLAAEADAGRGCLPRPAHVLRAFERPLADVKVLITGQDPYPTPGHSIGLAFAVDPAVRPLPRSLSNIYKEMHTDLGLRPAPTGDLRPWADQGVLLLNRVLTVSPGITGSHRRKGWEEVTGAAVRAVARRDKPLVAILWGNSARELLPVLGDTPAIRSAHPSPLSAARGFFGSRPFSRANALLAQQGAAPVDWSLGGG